VCFEDVIDRDPGGEAAVQAANLIADGYANEEDWAALESTALRFYEDEQLGDGTFEDSMLHVAGQAAMKQLMDPALNTDEVAEGWPTPKTDSLQTLSVRSQLQYST
jgi:hypothetical protein